MTVIYFTTFGILTLWVIMMVYLCKTALTTMMSMTITMTISTTAGLMIGMLLTTLSPYPYFICTFISMLVAAFIGIIVGWPKGLLVILDGIISGVMGGMMGAMLGFMLPQESMVSSIQVMSVIVAGILFLLYLFLASHVRTPRFLQHPLPFFSVVCLFLLLNHFTPFSIQELPVIQEHIHTWVV